MNWFSLKFTSLFLGTLLLGVVFIFPEYANAHQSGCHRWHSCPSDSGSYVCGDLGYYSECPGGSSTVSTYTYTSSTPTPTPTPSPTPTPKPVVVKKVIVKTIVSKEIPTVVGRLFRSVYGHEPTLKESTYWKMRARTDKKTEASLKTEMQIQKKKGVRH